MPHVRAIDAHAYILEADTIRVLQKEAPRAGFKLTPIDDEFGTLEFAGPTVGGFPCGGGIGRS